MRSSARWCRNFTAGRRQARSAVLAGLLCLFASACAPTAFEVRPVSYGFDAAASGVMDPYGDGKRQLAEGRAGLAIERFRQALAQNRNSVDALNGLAVAYARLGRTPLAETYLQRALDLRYDDVATMNNYGRLLMEQGRWQEARMMLSMAEQSAGGSDSAIIQGNLAAIETPRAPRPYRPAEAVSPFRLAKADIATYRLETMTAALPEVTTAAVVTSPMARALAPMAVSASSSPEMPSVAPAPIVPGPAETLVAVTPASPTRSARAIEGMAMPAAALLAPAEPPAAQPGSRQPAVLPPPAAEPPAPESPATGSRALQPAATTRLAPFIIVANGVGRTGLAAKWRERLGRDGIAIDSLANALPFEAARTEIRYHPFFAREAAALAALLPTSAALITDREALGDIYIELGPDSLETFGEPS